MLMDISRHDEKIRKAAAEEIRHRITEINAWQCATCHDRKCDNGAHDQFFDYDYFMDNVFKIFKEFGIGSEKAREDGRHRRYGIVNISYDGEHYRI